MQRALAVQRIARALAILQIGRVHESAPGPNAETLFQRAIDRARAEGLPAAEPDLICAALAGHLPAARAALSLAMRKAGGDDHPRALLEQLLGSSTSEAIGWLLGAEWHRFHRSSQADDAAWAQWLATAFFAPLPQAQVLVSLEAHWSGLEAPPDQAMRSQEALTHWLVASEDRWVQPAVQTLGEREGVRATLVSGFAPAAALTFPLRQLAPHLSPTLVVDPRSGQRVAHPVRDASYAQWLPELLGWHGKLLENRLARAGGYARECGEVTNLLRYTGGQAYKPHLDCLPHATVTIPQGEAQGGQRLLTQLLGVVAPDSGGETRFEHLDVQVTLAPGDLLTFNNATDDGQPLVASRHAGAPVTGGEKAIMSKWVRQTTTPYGRELAHTL